MMRRRDFCTGGAALAALLPAAIPAEVAARLPSIRAIERPRVLAAAGRYLAERPVTITAFKAVRSPGGPHDYYSEGDYWWPDPAHSGSPYVRRDGLSNPAKFDAHRDALIRLSVQMPALTAAWMLTGDARFSALAARHLKAWFVAPSTRMTPNLAHAQAIVGTNDGRGIGIIDTLHLVEVAQAARHLDDAHVPGYSAADRTTVKRWFAAYLDWMATSTNGRDEEQQKNNHGSCWLLQAVAFAALTGDAGWAPRARERFRTVILPTQISPDGSQPLELARTKPYSYCLFNLDVLSTLCHILSEPGDDLWRYRTPDGRGIAAAIAWMAPFIADKANWPRPPDVEHFDALPVRQPSLLFGSLALGRADWMALWRRLDPDPTDPEIIRNYPIRQPVLWVPPA